MNVLQVLAHELVQGKRIVIALITLQAPTKPQTKTWPRSGKPVESSSKRVSSGHCDLRANSRSTQQARALA